MPTSKIIRPAVFDETGEHVVPADADLNLDPVSSDPDNYIVRGSDGGAFLNGDGVLSNNGENLLKTDSADGKVTYSRSDAVSLINETVQPSLDKLGKKHDEDTAALQRAADKAQTAADKAQASADKAAESARQADEDAAAAQCTATQALNDAADAKAAADRAQARADAAYDKASDAQCAAADALDKAQEAVDSLPEIADAHSSIVTAGDGIKVAQSRLGDHNVYQVGVKANGDDSGLISSTDGLEIELKGNGGLDKDKDGLYVNQQWLNEIVARYSKEHMLFSQFKVVSSLPSIADADIHTIYLIRNKDSSASDTAPKDSFNGWIIVTTENGAQKWEEIGYKTDLTGYTHAGNTVKLTGDATGTGTVDANGNVVVPTAVSHAANADHATNADHAASADKTTGGTVSITGYVSGSGSFDRNGNVTVAVVPNIADTPSTWYVGKTNARDYWGKDENGSQWGSTKDHPFASLTYAINETNKHIFPGNTIKIVVVDSGDYDEHYRAECHVTTTTYIRHNLDSHPRFIGGWDFTIQSGNMLAFEAIDFEIAHSTTLDHIRNGQVFMRVFSGGIIQFSDGCHMSISDDNLGMNTWPFIELDGSNELRLIAGNGKKEPALYCELANGVTLHAPVFYFNSTGFGVMGADDNTPVVKIVSPAGTKISGSVISLGRFASTTLAYTSYPGYKVYFDWDIADDSELTQVNLGKFASLTVLKNPYKGVALPGHAAGNVPELANYTQLDY